MKNKMISILKYIKRNLPKYVKEEDIKNFCNVDSEMIQSLRANGYLDAQYSTIETKTYWTFRLTPIGYSHLIENDIKILTNDIKILTIWIIFLTIVNLLITIFT